jgi:hypothetical protein
MVHISVMALLCGYVIMVPYYTGKPLALRLVGLPGIPFNLLSKACRHSCLRFVAVSL